MSDQVPVSFITDFKDQLAMLSQQMRSKFADSVTVNNYIGKEGKVVDQIGELTGEVRTSRAGPIVLEDTPHDARWVYPEDWDVGDTVDTEDLLRTRLNLVNGYAGAMLAAANRRKDDVIIASFFANATTGEDAGTTTSFPSGNQIAVTEGAASATGLNTDKLLAAREGLLANEVDLETDTIYCAISARQERELIDQIKVANTDYREKAVFDDPMAMKGLRSWFGINFIHSERLQVDSNSYRRCPFYVKSGMHLGVWQDTFGDIYRLTERRRKPFYVTAGNTLGATRLEEDKVFEIKCSEA